MPTIIACHQVLKSTGVPAVDKIDATLPIHY